VVGLEVHHYFVLVGFQDLEEGDFAEIDALDGLHGLLFPLFYDLIRV